MELLPESMVGLWQRAYNDTDLPSVCREYIQIMKYIDGCKTNGCKKEKLTEP